MVKNKGKDRDADLSSSKGTNNNGRVVDPSQADHELFVQAFSKPTQIYRYLRERHLSSPVFLHRTLSYMTGRNLRNNNRRKAFKVNSIYENMSDDATTPSKFITLTFFEYNDPKVNGNQVPAQIEICLLTIGHKKRKDVSSIQQTSVGTAEVCTNPSEEARPAKAPTISVSTQLLSLRNGHQGNSYVLLLKVSVPVVSGSEPQTKRRRVSELSPNGGEEAFRHYAAELVVYDRHSRCLLVEGDYELVLKEANPVEAKGSSPVGQSGTEKSPRKVWSTIETRAPLDILNQGPTLNFRLTWDNEEAAPFVDRPRPHAVRSAPSVDKPLVANRTGSAKAAGKVQSNGGGELIVVRYQFLYNASRRQQTETRPDFNCPWCSLHCLHLQALMKHFRLCHSRFIFHHAGTENGHIRIDISVNETYDGSYSGYPHDLITQPTGFGGTTGGAAFGRQGPTRRTPITAMLIWRPRRLRAAGHDPMHNEGNDGNDVCETQRPFITGHNRLYHHTSTCLPIQAKELDVDSENEADPEWLRIKTCMMIDEFTDVNEGEKELMKLWNLHVMKHNYVGDCQMGVALEMFLRDHGKDLLGRNLYRNFILHLTNLYDFGIVGPATVLKMITAVQRILQQSPEHQEALKQAWLAQLLTHK